MLKYIFLFNCVLVSFLSLNLVSAQEKDSVEVEEKKPFKLYLHSIKVGTDVSYPILMIFDGNLVRYEVNSEFNLSNRFIFTADVGYSQMTNVKNIKPNRFTYTNTGVYARVGIDYNLMHKKFEDNAIFVGFRYGQAGFEHKIRYNLDTSNVWLDTPKDIVKYEKGMKVSWVEFTTGLRVRVWKQFYTGYTLRVMFRTSLKDGELISANELPGFGNNKNASNLHFNYHIFYQLPFGRNGKKAKE